MTTLTRDSFDLALELQSQPELVYSDGYVGRVRGNLLVAQYLHVTLQTVLGEWAWDTSLGLDWSLIRERPTRLAVIEAHVKRLIRRVPGVVGLDDVRLQVDRPTRALTLSGRVRTHFDDGALEFVGQPDADGLWAVQILIISGYGSVSFL